MRKDGGHASVHIVATGDGRVPDPDTSNIGDGIQWASRQDADLQSQVRASGSRLGSGALRESDGGQQQEHNGCKNLFGHRTGLLCCLFVDLIWRNLLYLPVERETLFRVSLD
jgi:hypothetical protein